MEGKDGCDAACRVVCADFAADSVMSADFHCYAGYDEATFEGASADCADRGAHLVTIETKQENELVRELVRTSKWIGAFEDVALTSQQAGEHVWITGGDLTFENWARAEPNREASRCMASGGLTNGSRCYEHCVTMHGDGTWFDARCDLADGYVCEWEPAGS